jgi:hypothetical protein
LIIIDKQNNQNSTQSKCEYIFCVQYYLHMTHTVNIAGIYANEIDAIYRIKDIMGASLRITFNNAITNGIITGWINKYPIDHIQCATPTGQPNYSIPIKI